MLHIKDEIEYLIRLLKTPPESRNDLFLRMYAWGLLTLFNRVNQELEKISTQLDTSLNLDAISMDIENYCDQLYWNFLEFYQRLKIRQSPESCQTDINRMTDYLPNDKDKYKITPDVLGSFKTAMHQLCDEERISSSALVATLESGYKKMMGLMYEIEKKVMNPQPYLYTKLWEEELSRYEDYEYESDYCNWIQEVGKPTFEQLKSRQKQEIFRFLNTGFLRFCNMPTGSEVKKCKLKITEDDLEYGTVIPDDFNKECARFEKFFEWQEDIFVMNYERIGQYVYKHYKDFDIDEDFFILTGFDKTMEYINEDMARLKPGLAKYLKRYAENELEELMKDCKMVFEPFKNYLKEDLRETLIDEYLEILLVESELKEEAKKMLGSKSKRKYCCSIVLALSFCNIFKPQYNGNEDLGRALYSGLGADNKETLVRYLKDPKNKNKALSQWTSRIMDNLKEHPFSRSQSG